MTEPTPETITLEMARESLYSAVVSDALDSLGLKHQSPRLQLRHITGQAKLVGRAKTTLWADMAHADPHPYALELAAVDNCQPESVMICAVGQSMRSAVWGELLSTAASNGGCIGVIVDGAVRDVEKMQQMGFTSFALGTSVYDSQNRQRVIDVDVAVEIAGVRFETGDLVIADADGVVVVPQLIEQQALRAAWEKVHAENHVRDEIRAGMKATEAFRKYGVL